MGTTSTPRRAALYLRQSLDRAEGIESQRSRCAALAQAKGWTVVATFEDNEVKASEDRGPKTGWGHMLPRIGKDFDIIVSVDLDRLARNTRDLNKLIDLGAAVITVDGEIDLTSADGEFRATMIVGIARFETRRASERQKRHKAAKAARGEWHGGTPPYGYQKQGKTLVPNEAEAALIREAADRLLKLHEKMHTIVVDWNSVVGTNPDGSPKLKHATRPLGIDADGNPKPGISPKRVHPYGAHWRQANLRSILLNRAMLGETKAGVIGWEPIIDSETFDKLHALLTEPSRKVTHSPGTKGGKYTMGGGLTVCSKCGKPLITAMKYQKTGEPGLVILSCLGRVHGPSEHHPKVERVKTRNGVKRTVLEDTGRVSIAHDVLEEYVFGKVVERLNDSDYWRKRRAEADPEAEQKIAQLNEARERLFQKRTRAEDLALDGLISKDRLREELRGIEAEVERIAKDIDALVAPPALEDLYGSRDKILDRWPRWNVGQRRAFLKLLIRRVVIGDWPEDMGKVFRPHKGESAEDYEKRHRALMLEATHRRTVIEWI